VTFFPAHFAPTLRRSGFALLALLCSAVLPTVARAQEKPKLQERFYLTDKVAEELGKIRPLVDAKKWDEALVVIDGLIKTAAPKSYDLVNLSYYKYLYLSYKNEYSQAIEPLETAVTLCEQFHYFENTVETELTQTLAQLYLLESQTKGIKPEQQKLCYSKAAHYADQFIQLTPNPTADNYFVYAQILYYAAMATPDKTDMEMLKKSQVQIEKGLLTVTHPKEQHWQILYGILIQQGDYVRAGEIVELLAKQFPNSKNYWPQLQNIYINLGANEKDTQKSLEYSIRAIITMERAQALGQLNTPKDNFALVAQYYNIGQFERVSELLQTGLRNGSIENLQPNWEYLATSYQQINKEQQAIEALKEAETHFPKAGSLHFQIAQIYSQTDKLDLAYNEAVKALEIGNIDKPGAIYCLMSYWAFDLHKYDEALVAVNKALGYPEGPKDPQIPRLKGAIQEAINERDRAKGPAEDQSKQPSAGQKQQPEPKKQPELKQSKSL